MANVDHFKVFFRVRFCCCRFSFHFISSSSLSSSFDVIYLTCIRSNWNYPPHVYYMTWLLACLDQCRILVLFFHSVYFAHAHSIHIVFCKPLHHHKVSSYEKKGLLALFSLKCSDFSHPIHHFRLPFSCIAIGVFFRSCFIFILLYVMDRWARKRRI